MKLYYIEKYCFIASIDMTSDRLLDVQWTTCADWVIYFASLRIYMVVDFISKRYVLDEELFLLYFHRNPFILQVQDFMVKQYKLTCLIVSFMSCKNQVNSLISRQTQIK